MSLVETLLWLCSIDSPTGEEGPLCDAIEARLRERIGGTAVRRHANSLVVPIAEARGGSNVVLAGHLDTVRTDQDGRPRLEGDRVYGRGASDMKAGLALMLELADAPRAAPSRAGLTLVLYAGEEGGWGGNELEVVLDRDDAVRSADFALCLEPSDNELQLGCAGSLHADVVFSGRSAHSARPWQGENAIHRAGPVLCDLGALAPKWTEVEGLRYATVTSATTARGGAGRNVVPAELVLNLNHRFAPGVTVEQAVRELERIVGGRAEVRVVDAAPSAMPHRSHPLVAVLEASGVRGVGPKQAWTDVARFEARGIPAANFGPGVQAQAHQRNEWASAAGIEEGMRILRTWIARVDEPSLAVTPELPAR
jgi:succinyl-diaminopimelate desuccinylase